MSNERKSSIDTNEDQLEVSSAGQALLRVAVVTLTAIAAAAFVLLALLLILTR